MTLLCSHRVITGVTLRPMSVRGVLRVDIGVILIGDVITTIHPLVLEEMKGCQD